MRRRKSSTLILSSCLLLMFYTIYLIIFTAIGPSFEGSRELLSRSSNLFDPSKRSLENSFSDGRKTYVRKGVVSCKEKTNIVFIKGMKCATTTMLGIFHRFGRTRNLTFVTPRKWNLYLNWPYRMSKLDFRPSSRQFNILTDHAVYTEDVMKSIMPADTVYISIVRHPMPLLKSTLKYFKVAQLAGVPEDVENPVVEYLKDLKAYEASYTAPTVENRFCVPDGFSMTKNLMSHCLGMPLGFPPGSKDISANDSAITDYILHLHRNFSLILIVEYFYESLVLMKRLLCWQFSDIIFVSANVEQYSYKTKPIPKDVQEIHERWSSIDYKLFEFFNKTLWTRIHQQGSDFFSEVDAFRAVEQRVTVYCNEIYKLGKNNPSYTKNLTSLPVPSTEWSSSFVVLPEDCWMLGPGTYDILIKRQEESNKEDAELLKDFHSIPDTRTEKGLC